MTSNLEALQRLVENLAGAQLSPDPRDAYEYLEAARLEAQRLLDEARQEQAAMDEWMDGEEAKAIETVLAGAA